MEPMHYLDLLRRLHEELQPAGYLEIGVDWGDSLQLSRARSVAIDPAPKPRPESLLGKPALLLYVGTSDDFFREHQQDAIFLGVPLDFAFIDGLHEFPQVVRDLENVERWGHHDTVVAIHDVLPRNAWEAARDFHDGFWTGDVWRIVPFLRQHRPDLRLWLTEADPTGVLLISGLDPAHPGMAHLAEAQAAAFPSIGPDYDRLTEEFIAGAAAEPAEDVLGVLGISRRLDREWGYRTHLGMQWADDNSWQPLLKASASWPHTLSHHLGLRASLRLIEEHWLPEDVRQQAFMHLTRYASPLASLWPDVEMQPLTLPETRQMPLCSPSPVVVAGDLVTFVWTPAANGDAPVWWQCALDRELAVQSASVLGNMPENASEPGVPTVVSSISQIRPFVHEERLRAMVTVHDRHQFGLEQLGLVAISDRELKDFHLLTEPATGRPERDWAPFLSGDGIRAVSWWEPTEIMRIVSDENAYSQRMLRLAPRLAERFLGASPGVDVPGGWLFLVNERAEMNEGDESYFARFIFLRHDFWVTAVSPHFWVVAQGQDVASGLTRQEDDLIAGFTSRGQDALLAKLPLSAVLASLLPLSSKAAPSVADEGEG